MLLLAVLPVALRLLLLPNHPVPTPDIYDEFGHLLVADTLRHFRLANPPLPRPEFFETFFVLQRPTYSSIYPIGQGLALAIGWTLFGLPWAGVLLSTAAFCALCYWMLRALDHPGLGPGGRTARRRRIRPPESVDEQLLGRRASRHGRMPGVRRTAAPAPERANARRRVARRGARAALAHQAVRIAVPISGGGALLRALLACSGAGSPKWRRKRLSSWSPPAPSRYSTTRR